MIQTLFGPSESKPGLIERLKKAVQSTKSILVTRMDDIVRGKKEIDAGLLEELEQILLSADVGMATTQEVLEAVRNDVDRGKTNDALELKAVVKRKLMEILRRTDTPPKETAPPVVILVVGVNGTGKTTTR